jgi:hypothetical protein
VKSRGRHLDIEEYEAATGPLTELLYTVAQLPSGTAAEANLLGEVQRVGRLVRLVTTPGRELKRLARDLAGRARSLVRAGGGLEAATTAPLESAADASANLARVLDPAEPVEHSLSAYATVVANLGWDRHHDKLVFAHTHQPLAGRTATPLPPVRSGHPTGAVRFWNTGCWIYEPTLGSLDSYERYLRVAWPGTGVLVDTERDEPELIEVLADLNPLPRGAERLRDADAQAAYRRAREAGRTFPVVGSSTNRGS